MHYFLVLFLKINNQLVEDGQDLHIVMPMYNLLYYYKNYQQNMKTDCMRN